MPAAAEREPDAPTPTDRPMTRRSRRTRPCCAPTRTAASACSPTRPAASSSPTATTCATASARIDTDMRHYYVLTYVPKNTDFDGKFRTHRRQGEAVGRARALAQGLLRGATPPPARRCSTTRRRRWPRSSRTPVPNAFPVRALPLRFPEAGRPGLAPVLVTRADERHHVPAVPRTRRPTRPTSSSSSGSRTTTGQVLDKMSQRYRAATARSSSSTSARTGEVLFYREPVLDPGTSTRSRRWSTTRWPTRPSVRFGDRRRARVDPKALRLSSLVAVRSEREASRRPSACRAARSSSASSCSIPSMGEPFSKAASRSCRSTSSPTRRRRRRRRRRRCSCSANGQKLAEAPLELAAADADGPHRAGQPDPARGARARDLRAARRGQAGIADRCPRTRPSGWCRDVQTNPPSPVALALAAAAALPPGARARAAAIRARPARRRPRRLLESVTTAVLVDVVVRDGTASR